jgi:hypothetical protein
LKRQEAVKPKELRKQGHWGMSKHAITRHEKREARKKTAATTSAEVEAAIREDYDGAVADEAIDNGALEAVVLVETDHATKEAEKEAQVKQKNEVSDTKKMLALKEQLRKYERTDRPRRRVTSTASLLSTQNEFTVRGGGTKAKPKKVRANKQGESKPKRIKENLKATSSKRR